MRTARSSGRRVGGLHQSPPGADPPGADPQTRYPPAARHAGIPPAVHAGIAPPAARHARIPPAMHAGIPHTPRPMWTESKMPVKI